MASLPWAAVVGALAGLDHHDVLVEGLAVLAAELDADGAGLLWAAAAAVHAGAQYLGRYFFRLEHPA